MDSIVLLVIFQAALSTFNTLYHHEYTENLPGNSFARRELKIHSIKSSIFGALILCFAWFQVGGWIIAIPVIAVIAGLILSMWDLVVEANTRKLPPLERITHTLLSINFGVILTYLYPEVLFWFRSPTEVTPVFYGMNSLVLSLLSIGAFISAFKDWQRSIKLKSKNVLSLGFEVENCQKKRILVTGGSGFIGKRLVEVLISQHHEVTILTRDIPSAARGLAGRVGFVTNFSQIDSDSQFDVIINLAGEPLAKGRWTKKRKEKFVQSRLSVTAGICDLIKRLKHKPEVLISGSAIGFYGPHDDEVLDENGRGVVCFSHSLCHSWEQQALQAQQLGVRVCLLRIGIVLGQDGGPLAELRLPFEFGCAMKIGDGKQWMSWIHRDDLVAMILYLFDRPELQGAFNATAPVPVSNGEFKILLSQYLKTFVSLKIPSTLLSLMVGELADEVLITGQRVIPAKIQASGFKFIYPKLDDALIEIIGPKIRTNQ